ncbi:hypothetical protein ACQKGO_10315 [Corallococcus interemptor]|uniref:hypothetical protein n=1 Tax=Corallococcus interemptor TaxID=2316720 RepID=UPI003CFE6700
MSDYLTTPAPRLDPFKLLALGKWLKLLDPARGGEPLFRNYARAGLGSAEVPIERISEPMADESMLRVLEPTEHTAFKMTFGGDDRSFSTRAIAKEYLGKPYTLAVTFKNGHGAPVQRLGHYVLNLAKMLEAGLVRIERQKTGVEVVRLIVQQRGAEFYIQLNQSSPKLRLPQA